MPRSEYINVRLDADTKAKLKAAAETENRTISNYVENLIKKELEEKKMYIAGRYDYEELKDTYLSIPTSENLEKLANWYENYGGDSWNGEYFDDEYIGRIFRLYSEPNEDEEFDIIGYEVR